MEIPSNIEPKPAFFKAQTTELNENPPSKWAPQWHVRQIRISGSWPLSVWPVKMTRTQVAVKMTGTLDRGTYYSTPVCPVAGSRVAACMSERV